MTGNTRLFVVGEKPSWQAGTGCTWWALHLGIIIAVTWSPGHEDPIALTWSRDIFADGVGIFHHSSYVVVRVFMWNGVATPHHSWHAVVRVFTWNGVATPHHSWHVVVRVFVWNGVATPHHFWHAVVRVFMGNAITSTRRSWVFGAADVPQYEVGIIVA